MAVKPISVAYSSTATPVTPLSGKHVLRATFSSTATLSVALRRTRPVRAAFTSTAAVAATLRRPRDLQVAISSTATLAATLTPNRRLGVAFVSTTTFIAPPHRQNTYSLAGIAPHAALGTIHLVASPFRLTGIASTLHLGVPALTAGRSMLQYFSTATPSFTQQDAPRQVKISFGDGYNQIYPLGLTPLDLNLTLSWSEMPKADVDRILSYLRSTPGQAISFVSPDEITPRAWLPIKWTRSHPYPDSDALSITFEDRPFAPVSNPLLVAPAASPPAINLNDATLDLNFINGSAFSPLIAYSRASGGSYYDATGMMRTAASNAPRIDYGPTPGGVTNWLRNGSGAGAVIGTPGTNPTYWSTFTNVTVGNAISITGIGTENGIGYIEYTFAGTSTIANSTQGVTFDTNIGVAAQIGQTWTASFYVRLISASVPAGTDVAMISGPVNSVGGYLAAANTIFFPTMAGLETQRISHAYSNTDPTTTNQKVQFKLAYNNAITSPFSVTLRIGSPQLEQSASAHGFVPTSTGATNAGATPLGLLIEDSRTNYCPNSTQIVATWGTVVVTNNAVPAPDGTLTAGKAVSGASSGGFQPTNYVAPAAATYTISVWARADVAGSTGRFIYTSYILSGSQVAAVNNLNLTTAWQRFSFVVVVPSGASQLGWQINLTVASDTVYVWGTQTEINGGVVASSYIATTSAAVTRAADVATVPIAALVSPTAGSVVAEAMLTQVPAANNEGVLLLDNGTASQQMVLYHPYPGTTTPAMACYGVGSGVTIINANLTSTMVAGVPFKTGFTYGAGAVPAANYNGGVMSSGISGYPVGLTTLRLGVGNLGPASWLNGYLRRVRMWRRILNSSELSQADT